MTYKEITKSVANELNLSNTLVDRVYKAYWLFIKTKIQELPLKDDITETDFHGLKTNFNIPSLGKLCCTRDRYVNMKKRFEYIKKIKDNAKS